MATSNIMTNLMNNNQGQVSKGMQAMGMTPVGNAGGSNLPGPTGIQDIAQPAMPGANPTVNSGAVPTVNPIYQSPVSSSGTLVNQGGVGGAIPVSQQTASQKQLDNVFGKGIGGDISSVINNLGSNDSTYMQAYTAAMAPQNAENLATLNTTLGNSGISANSSTAAIANADFQSQVTSQEGLQEQQLQQLDEQNLIGLLTSTEGPANKQASTSVVGDIGATLSTIAGMF